jgi:hypothetical protein
MTGRRYGLVKVMKVEGIHDGPGPVWIVKVVIGIDITLILVLILY